jgi:hypothetical protein
MSSNRMRAKCEKCGANSAIQYISIPNVDVTFSGEHVKPSDWTHVITCPNCGDREQRIPAKSMLAVTSSNCQGA